MARYAQTTTAISIHSSGDSPTFGETAVVVSLDDDGAGPFIVLRSLSEEGGTVSLDFDQLLLVADAAKMLIDGLEDDLRKEAQT